MVFLDGWEYQGLHRVEYAGAAEKAGNVDQHVVIQRFDLRGMALHEFRVFLDVLDFVHHHAPLNAPQNGGLPVVREIHAGGPSQDWKIVFNPLPSVGTASAVPGKVFRARYGCLAMRSSSLAISLGGST